MKDNFYIAIDFDGTIAKHEFPNIGEVVPGAIKWIKRFKKLGAKIILWTMRSDGQDAGDVLNDAIRFCSKRGITFDAINYNLFETWSSSHKQYAHVYIDDAAIGCPLVYGMHDKPYVDWDIVGPMVEEAIQYHNVNKFFKDEQRK